MKKIIGIVLIAMLMSGCVGSYVQVGAGYNASFTNTTHKWNNADTLGATIELGQEWELSDQVGTKCFYLHVSQWMAGPPFNDDAESSLDHFGCAIKFKVTQKP